MFIGFQTIGAALRAAFWCAVVGVTIALLFIFAIAAHAATVGNTTFYSGANSASVAKTVLNANPNRINCGIKNPASAATSVWVKFGATATADQNSIDLSPGQAVYCAGPTGVTPQSVSIITTDGHAPVVWEQQ